MTTNSFNPKSDGSTLEVKEFANNFNETLTFANHPINSDKVAIVQVTIPENTYNQLNHMNLDTPIFSIRNSSC